jgi:Alcohol dehydrogenase GroES-like domain
VGDGVDRVKVSDMVCLPLNIGCGFCKNCGAGLTEFCLTANPGSLDLRSSALRRLLLHESLAPDCVLRERPARVTRQIARSATVAHRPENVTEHLDEREVKIQACRQ